jgi:hypothetical protein
MLRVFAHLYACDFSAIAKHGMEKTTNTVFAHFLVFSIVYYFIPEDEMEIVEPVFRRTGERPKQLKSEQVTNCSWCTLIYLKMGRRAGPAPA